MHACDRQTDRRTDGQNYDSQDRPRICSRGKNEMFQFSSISFHSLAFHNFTRQGVSQPRAGRTEWPVTDKHEARPWNVLARPRCSTQIPSCDLKTGLLWRVICKKIHTLNSCGFSGGEGGELPYPRSLRCVVAPVSEKQKYCFVKINCWHSSSWKLTKTILYYTDLLVLWSKNSLLWWVTAKTFTRPNCVSDRLAEIMDRNANFTI